MSDRELHDWIVRLLYAAIVLNAAMMLAVVFC